VATRLLQNTIIEYVPNPLNIPLKSHSNWAKSIKVDYWRFLVEVSVKYNPIQMRCNVILHLMATRLFTLDSNIETIWCPQDHCKSMEKL
jgi:hypothetical protein